MAQARSGSGSAPESGAASGNMLPPQRGQGWPAVANERRSECGTKKLSSAAIPPSSAPCARGASGSTRRCRIRGRAPIRMRAKVTPRDSRHEDNTAARCKSNLPLVGDHDLRLRLHEEGEGADHQETQATSALLLVARADH